MHARACKYPRSRHLLLRQTRVSLRTTGQLTLEQEVLSDADTGVRYPIKHYGTLDAYPYPNGSIIQLGGLDNPTKFMSGQYDTIYIVEATEADEDAWQKLLTRLRNGRMPYAQLYGDCNPDGPLHWLKLKNEEYDATKGARGIRFINTTHADNPKYWDSTIDRIDPETGWRGDWTPAGRNYVVEILSQISGVNYLRYVKGVWAAADGLVYPDFSPQKHFFVAPFFDRYVEVVVPGKPRMTPPKDWPLYLSIDFGYDHPFVCQFWTRDPDDRLIMFLEIYMSQKTVDEHAKKIVEVLKEYDLQKPEQIICDHDAENRAQLDKHLGSGMKTRAAKKGVMDGLDAVRRRLKLRGDGTPGLYLRPDCVVEVDRRLLDNKRPWSTTREIGNYVLGKNEKPVKENDDGLDAAQYLVATLDLKPKDKMKGTHFPR
jgi:Phage terminase large subunit